MDNISDQDVVSRIFYYIELQIIKQFPLPSRERCTDIFQFFKISKFFHFTDGSSSGCVDSDAVKALGCLLKSYHTRTVYFQCECRIVFQLSADKREIGINSYSRIGEKAQDKIRNHYNESVLKTEVTEGYEDTVRMIEDHDEEDKAVQLFGARKEASSLGIKSIKNLAVALSDRLIDVTNIYVIYAQYRKIKYYDVL